MKNLELIISRAVNVFRDIYQYTVAGLVFMILWVILNQIANQDTLVLQENVTFISGLSPLFIIIIFFIAYLIGQALLVLSGVITRTFRKLSFFPINKRLNKKERELTELAALLFPNSVSLSPNNKFIILLEMIVFEKKTIFMKNL